MSVKTGRAFVFRALNHGERGEVVVEVKVAFEKQNTFVTTIVADSSNWQLVYCLIFHDFPIKTGPHKKSPQHPFHLRLFFRQKATKIPNKNLSQLNLLFHQSAPPFSPTKKPLRLYRCGSDCAKRCEESEELCQKRLSGVQEAALNAARELWEEPLGMEESGGCVC